MVEPAELDAAAEIPVEAEKVEEAPTSPTSPSRKQVLLVDEVVQKKERGDAPGWVGEAWARDDGLVLNLPVFQGCGIDFKRLILRAIRQYEFEDRGQETWWDAEYEEIMTLEKLDADRLPPLRLKMIGEFVGPEEYLSKGGDYDPKLVVVLSGTVEKLVGDAPNGGRCIVRTMYRGDCDGLTEFIGVGSDQRTCAFRAGPEGAHIRYVERKAITALLTQSVPEVDDGSPCELDEDGLPIPKPETPRWPTEVAYFKELALDRIDALHHKASKELLQWHPAGDEPFEYLKVQGQDLFYMDNALGTSVSGPLPEGIEERYFFNGQTVIKKGVVGDCLMLILRGEVEAEVPDGCGGQCLLRKYTPDSDSWGQSEGQSWLGDGRLESAPMFDEDGVISDSGPSRVSSRPQSMKKDPPTSAASGRPRAATAAEKLKDEVALVALVPPANLKWAMKLLRREADAGNLDLTDQTTTDWRWSWDDPRALVVINILRKKKFLSPLGEDKADAVQLYQHPLPPPPKPGPQAVLGSGAMIGHLALLGVPVVLAGTVRARGPVLVCILHRHVLLEALRPSEDRKIFEPVGLTVKDWVRALSKPKTDTVANERPSHLGPVTGPPPRLAKELVIQEAKAATYSAYSDDVNRYKGMAGADALQHVLLNALRDYALLWDLICDAPPRLLEALVKEFTPRYLLPNEVVIVDEEPNADFLFVVIHGDFVVSLEGAEIGRISQGGVQGASQLLRLNDWTRTVIVDPCMQGEAMIMVLRRDQLLAVLDGHPVPKLRLRDIEESLRESKEADWQILKNIPAFGSTCFKPFLSRIHKDADITLWCPGDNLAEVGCPQACAIVVLAGELRSEQPQTLFHVKLTRGHWCFQDNILGNEPNAAHDVVAVTHCMVLLLYRHCLLNAVVAYPECREPVMENETWRESSPQIGNLRVFDNVPAPVLSRLEREASPMYYRKGAYILAPGATVAHDSLLFILRGEARVSILGIETRQYHVGEFIGVHRFLRLPSEHTEPNPALEIVATAATDAVLIRSDILFEAMHDDRYEDDMVHFKNACRVLGGGDILDAFGFAVGGEPAVFATDCIEKSEVFRACSSPFVAQIPKLVEEVAFWPGEKLYGQGDEGTYMYFIQAGRVRCEALGRKEHEVVVSGATLGEMACLGQVAGHIETAFAESHVWVRVLHRNLLQRALSSFPEEESRLMGAATKGGDGLFDQK